MGKIRSGASYIRDRGLQQCLAAVIFIFHLLLGTIFETECKKGLKGKGLLFVREVCDYCRSYGNIPVFAIGGITPDNIEDVKKAGARGGCMMSYMMQKAG